MSISTLHQTIEKMNFSGVISIRQHQSVIFEKAYGFQDRSNRILNNVDTKFGIASGTKLFTALAIGTLIDQGKLSLQTCVWDILQNNFPSYAKHITIQHLLTHTSGIPDYYDEDLVEDFDNFTMDIPWYDLREPSDYLPIFPHREMKFIPGTSFSYCNSGYILLAAVIAQITSMHYADYVRQVVLDPCTMTNTGFYPFNCLPENTAWGYIEEDNGRWRTNIYNLPIVGGGDGGIYSTANDLYKLWDCFYHAQLLSNDLTALYIDPFMSAGYKDPNVQYGHGIWIYTEGDGNQRESIVGSDGGVSFKSQHIASKDIVYSILSNTSEGAWDIGEAVRTFVDSLDA